jgi:hypothetical protein
VKRELRNLELAARSVRAAEQRVEQRIREADTAGCSLREIAAVTPYSHETIRRLLKEGQ